MVLAHVITFDHPVNGVVGRKNQAPLDALAIVDGALEAQRIEREVFQRLLGAIQVRAQA